MNTQVAVVDSKNKGNVWPYLFLLILLISCSLNVYLARRLSSERRANIPVRNTGSPAVGATISQLSLIDADGKPVVLSFGTVNKPTLLYLYSPKCHWCDINLPNIQAIAKQRGQEYRIVGINTDPDVPSLLRYLATKPLGFPTLTASSFKNLVPLGFVGTPQTILLNPQGKIIANWSGAYAYDQTAANEIETTLSVKLPQRKVPPRTEDLKALSSIAQ